MYAEESKKNTSKKVIKIVLIILGAIILFVGGFALFLVITAYRPDDVTPLEFTQSTREISADNLISIVTLNTGYASLDKDATFYMDGGEGVLAESKEKVEENIAGINRTLELLPADFYFLQEVDNDSTRAYHVNQTNAYLPDMTTRIYAQNHLCKWIPSPLPMLGKVDSGLLLLTNCKITSSERISLPDTKTGLEKLCYLKRCLQVSRAPIADSDKELVLINLHMEAYTSDKLRKKQLNILMNLLTEERNKGNYVIAGGDFNTTFPNTTKKYPLQEGLWAPSAFDKNSLPEGFSFKFDRKSPTCRLTNIPNENREDLALYVIDGFIVSDNVDVDSVMTLDFDFVNTDHNPVMMYFRLK